MLGHIIYGAINYFESWQISEDWGPLVVRLEETTQRC